MAVKGSVQLAFRLYPQGKLVGAALGPRLPLRFVHFALAAHAPGEGRQAAALFRCRIVSQQGQIGRYGFGDGAFALGFGPVKSDLVGLVAIVHHLETQTVGGLPGIDHDRRLRRGVQTHRPEVNAAFAEEQIIAVGFGPPPQKGDVGFVLVDHEAGLAGTALRIEAQAVALQNLRQDVLVRRRRIAPPDFADVGTVKLERVVLAFDRDGGGACIFGIAGVDFADKPAHDLLDAGTESGFHDDRFPGRQQAAVLNQPLALLVAPGFKLERRHCRLVPPGVHAHLQQNRIEIADFLSRATDPDNAFRGFANLRTKQIQHTHLFSRFRNQDDLPFHGFQEHVTPEQVVGIGIEDAPPQPTVVIVVSGQEIQTVPGLDHVLDNTCGRADGPRADTFEFRSALLRRRERKGLVVA